MRLAMAFTSTERGDGQAGLAREQASSLWQASAPGLSCELAVCLMSLVHYTTGAKLKDNRSKRPQATTSDPSRATTSFFPSEPSLIPNHPRALS